MSLPYNKPYLKYAGGKSRILEPLLEVFPNKINTFYEPFVGSGSVALNIKAVQYVLSDLNSDLINCHKCVAQYPHKIINLIDKLFLKGRDDYTLLRDAFNSKSYTAQEQAALFIYLNRHCFNGMSRYNRKGEFNVPVGKGAIKKPVDEILSFGTRLARAQIGTSSFEKPMSFAKSGDVVYCDPPYVPASITLSNINYTDQGFPLSAQQRLVECAKASRDNGAFVAISNHDTEVTRELYKDATEIVEISVHRSISSKSNTRGKVQELVAIYK